MPITVTELRQRLKKSIDEHCEITVDSLKKILADYNLEEQQLIAITQLLNNAFRDKKNLNPAAKSFSDHQLNVEILAIINTNTSGHTSLCGTKKFSWSDSALTNNLILNVRKIKPLAQRIER